MTLNEIAAKYIGITEKPNNGGFSDPDFEARMKKDGEWQKGWAWCCCFVQLCVAEYYGEEHFKRFYDEYLTPSVVATFRNFENAGFEIKKRPEKGDLVFWQFYKNGKPTSFGHEGIVHEVLNNSSLFSSIEGNTNTKGHREGECVALKDRETDFSIPKNGNGLRLMGFIRLENKL